MATPSQQPGAERPALMNQEQFAALWSGRLVLMARRSALQHLSSRFDVSWFLSAIQKYRRMFVEVLVASFFLQVFALVSPLIFQVVIDKVLVHQSMSTLDVLIVGLLAIAVFETVLSILRTYVFSHTTNRIDVELTDAELAARKAAFKAPAYKFTRGTLYKYIKNVKSASEGCVTDE